MIGKFTDAIENHAGAVLLMLALVMMVSLAPMEKAAQALTPADVRAQLDGLEHPGSMSRENEADLAALESILDRVVVIYQSGNTTVMQFCRRDINNSPWFWKFVMDDGRTVVLEAVRCSKA